MNDHWNVLYQVSVFFADWKSKMAGNIPAKFGSNRPSGFGEEA
jgi:hypothetical protein